MLLTKRFLLRLTPQHRQPVLRCQILKKGTLVSLYNKFKNMDFDEEQLREQVHKVYDKLESLGVTKEDVKSIFGKLVDMVKDILN